MNESSNWMQYRSGSRTSEQLSRQCLGRNLTETEQQFAEALETIFAGGTEDFDAVATELTSRGVAAPSSGRTKWSKADLVSELKAINEELDAAYQENGFGA